VEIVPVRVIEGDEADVWMDNIRRNVSGYRDPALRERFEREARTVARGHHAPAATFLAHVAERLHDFLTLLTREIDVTKNNAEVN